MLYTLKSIRYGLLSSVLLISNGMPMMAQTNAAGASELSAYRIDCNVAGRRIAEVNEEGYTPWEIKNATANSLSLDKNIRITLTTDGGAKMTSGYYKAGIQEPYLAKLVDDGLCTDNSGKLELRISGLAKGNHTIQTYHNNYSVDNKVEVPSFDVYAQGRLVHANQQCTRRSVVKEETLILKTDVYVAKEGEDVVLSFQPKGDAANKVCSVYLNGVEIDTPDILKQSQQPSPFDGDMHADADSGTMLLKWKPAAGAVKHHLYVGCDAAELGKATTATRELYKGALQTTQYSMNNLSNLNTYYWRVDEEDGQGRITRGNVWSFKPRHLAFYEAEGYGRFAIGGRGGKVVYVTNLNDDGPGSFREAVTHEIGPRTIVFAVSGTIHLKSRLTCSSPYVTIAGQTAPGKGICIQGAPFGVGSDGICRFIRVRLGKGRTFDGIGMAGANHSITDHCSISWTIDEAFSSRGAKNMTLQRTLISEALNVAGHKNYAKGKGHGYAATIGGNVGSFHHNLLAHCAGRNWSMGGGLDGNGYYSGRLDLFNNVVYNWGGRATDGGAHEVNFVNNYYKAGPSTTQMFILRAQLEGVGKGSQSYYCEGNILQKTDGKQVTDNESLRRYELSHGQVLDWQVWVDKPFFPSYARIESAADAYKSVLSDVGCTMPLFDEHDARVVKEVLDGGYTYTGSIGKLPGIIDDEQDAGGYEEYPAETRAADFDTDRDGLPDWWEKLHGTNPNSASGDFSDANADVNGDGYTALEDYLEWMSVPHYYLNSGGEKQIDLSGLFAGYKAPVFTASCPDAKATVTAHQLTVQATGKQKGIVYVEVSATDKEGSKMARRIGFCIE